MPGRRDDEQPKLSRELAGAAGAVRAGAMDASEVAERLGDRFVLLLAMLLVLPFLPPGQGPGRLLAAGMAAALLGLAAWTGSGPDLLAPVARGLGRWLAAALDGLATLLAFLEMFARPRGGGMAARPWLPRLCGALIVPAAVMLAVCGPAGWANLPWALAILLLSLAALERDGPLLRASVLLLALAFGSRAWLFWGLGNGGALNTPWAIALASSLPPALVSVGAWTFLSHRAGLLRELQTVTWNRAGDGTRYGSGRTFAGAAGTGGALLGVLDYLKHPERYSRRGVRIPRGVLLVGSPGAGNTRLARDLSGEAGVPLLSLSGAGFTEALAGTGAAQVGDLFARAHQLAPSIVFIDELDALGGARGVSMATRADGEREQALDQLLAEMDALDPWRGVLALAATSRPDMLDARLLRPGRFDCRVEIDPLILAVSP